MEREHFGFEQPLSDLFLSEIASHVTRSPIILDKDE